MVVWVFSLHNFFFNIKNGTFLVIFLSPSHSIGRHLCRSNKFPSHCTRPSAFFHWVCGRQALGVGRRASRRPLEASRDVTRQKYPAEPGVFAEKINTSTNQPTHANTHTHVPSHVHTLIHTHNQVAIRFSKERYSNSRFNYVTRSFHLQIVSIKLRAEKQFSTSVFLLIFSEDIIFFQAQNKS